MKRRLLNLLTALSLVLCIATSVLWARSYNVLYALKRTRVDRRTGAVRVDQCFLASGRLRMSASRFHGDPDLWSVGWRLYRDPYYYAFRSDSPGTWLASWNADRRTEPTGGTATTRSVTVNLPVVVALAAAGPAAWRVRHLRRQSRRRRGLCTS